MKFLNKLIDKMWEMFFMGRIEYDELTGRVLIKNVRFKGVKLKFYNGRRKRMVIVSNYVKPKRRKP